MQITDVRTIFIDRYLFVEVDTDAGITGLGESGAWGFLEASAAAVETFKRYLIGQDPLRIEHHWQYLYRWSHFRGAAVMGALSAVDIALWDIAGKHFGVPAYQLLGGKVRDKARVYYHVFGQTKEELIAGCVDAREKGFTAVGHLTPFLDDSRDLPYFKTHVAMIEDAIETVAAYRQAVGRDVDLCIEIHRRLTPSEAIVLGRGIEPYHPFFYEDPVTPDNLDEMALVASKIGIPIATGERLHSIWEFQALLQRGAVQFCASGRLHGGRVEPRKEDCSPGRGVSCAGCTAQSPQPGQHRSLHSTGGLYPKLRFAGVPQGRGRTAQERDRQKRIDPGGRLPHHSRRTRHRHRIGGECRRAPSLRPARSENASAC